MSYTKSVEKCFKQIEPKNCPVVLIETSTYIAELVLICPDEYALVKITSNDNSLHNNEEETTSFYLFFLFRVNEIRIYRENWTMSLINGRVEQRVESTDHNDNREKERLFKLFLNSLFNLNGRKII